MHKHVFMYRGMHMKAYVALFLLRSSTVHLCTHNVSTKVEGYPIVACRSSVALVLFQHAIVSVVKTLNVNAVHLKIPLSVTTFFSPQNLPHVCQHLLLPFDRTFINLNVFCSHQFFLFKLLWKYMRKTAQIYFLNMCSILLLFKRFRWLKPTHWCAKKYSQGRINATISNGPQSNKRNQWLYA